ncbi:alpha/beta hydrolase [Nocardia colli]|uniref:alpha/beta hydrolase n=1 Tax=Nocardia colli TaxID=2545717 RepID=UPI0035DF8578
MRLGKRSAPKTMSPGQLGRRRRVRTVGTAALTVLASFGVITPNLADAAPLQSPLHRSQGGYEELSVPSSMGAIKVQVQWASDGGNAALYLLDGLRARSDRNAWSFETNAMDQFKNDNVTLVMPVGGESSFYTNWYGPSNLNGQKFTYKWETFLTEELPAFLEGLGVSPRNNAIAGLSMGGSAALALAAYHRNQFRHASSFSGYLSLSSMGMREAIRLAMLDAGRYNVDAMAPPASPQWLRLDATVFAPQLRNLPMYVSAASGVPGEFDRPNSALGVYNTSNAMALEALSLVGTRAFESRLASIGIPARFDFPAAGTHSWPYWQRQLANARPDILNALDH